MNQHGVKGQKLIKKKSTTKTTAFMHKIPHKIPNATFSHFTRISRGSHADLTRISRGHFYADLTRISRGHFYADIPADLTRTFLRGHSRGHSRGHFYADIPAPAPNLIPHQISFRTRPPHQISFRTRTKSQVCRYADLATYIRYV